MRCYVCGRLLLRAAATVRTADGTGYAGPTCAVNAKLLAEPMRRARVTQRRRRNDARQMEFPR